ncbi:MAG: hypothetical protein CUN55_03025 [Phototrophicales bacterium]|nr:MAG: hypothetical protein CUN55_03025 [Phototrophicales bacterium]
MKIDYRVATLQDAKGIYEVQQATWPKEITSSQNVQNILLSEQHVIIVAAMEKHIVGYISCFATTRQTATYWEHDQLAVHPNFRGKGIGYELITRAYDIGCIKGVDRHRAWIQINNIASQRVFSKHEFHTNIQLYQLFVCKESLSTASATSLHGTLIPVQTLSYSGYWLEGTVSPNDFIAARHILSSHSKHIVGMMIPCHKHELIEAAKNANYQSIDFYHQWWRA